MDSNDKKMDPLLKIAVSAVWSTAALSTLGKQSTLYLSVTNKHTADKKPYMGSKRFHFTCKRRQISGNSIFYITLFSAGTWTTKKVARLNSSPALAVSPPFVRACDIAMLLNSSYAT